MPIARTVALVLCAALSFTSAAQATAPTTTTITTPSGPGVLGLVHKETGGNYQFQVGGTSDGTSGAVDVRCYYLDENGARAFVSVVDSVAVNPDGTFSSPSGNASRLSLDPCTVLAVPHGTNPSDLTPFHGPRATAAIASETVQSGGPNDGKRYDFYDAVAMDRGYADFEAAAGCGIDFSRPFLAAPASGLQQEGPHLFDCNGWYVNDEQTGPSTHRTAIRIDGRAALAPHSARDILQSGAWPAITHTPTYDPATGRLTITDDEPLVECATDPGTSQISGSCPPFATDGVVLHRTQIIDHGGRVITQTDAWSSSTGQHALDLASDEYFVGNHRVQQFPGESALTPHTTQYGIVSIASSGHPVSILDETDPALPDGAALNPRSSTSMWPVADTATMMTTTGESYLLHYALTIPASGTLTITRIYAQDFKAADLAVLTSEAEDRLEGPALSLTAPADGTTVNVPSVTVSGNATDNKAVSSLTVNGQPATISSGTFSKDVALAEGPNTITVVASDATGNTATATRSVTYTKPAPPPPPAKPTIAPNGTVSCPAGGAACIASGRWVSRQAFAAAKKKRHRVVLATWSATIQPGKTAKAAPKLTAAGRRLLRKRSVPATRTITARAGSGTPVSSTAKVTLKRIRHRKH